MQIGDREGGASLDDGKYATTAVALLLLLHAAAAAASAAAEQQTSAERCGTHLSGWQTP